MPGEEKATSAMAEDKQKDYYVLLGISRSADAKCVRNAFRRLAKKHHPDTAEGGSPAEEKGSCFRTILEAYQVLSDADRRKSYDALLRRLAKEAERKRAKRSRTAPLRKSHPNDPSSVREEAFFYFRDVDYEVILSPDEARRGVRAEVSIPLSRPCPLCGGFGESGLMDCRYCAGQGEITEEKWVRFDIPGGVRDGGLFEITVSEGTPLEKRLRVLIRIASGA